MHGTNSPYSVPGRRSHGCMRMHNEDILIVRQMVDKDSKVTILPDPVPDVD
ncbi:L,D-transpeptidase [uncultured Duncaniella sp.]|uniref:L,D-transpeptidase n=1 Tax=uncultured Duncaniella sp. TaxID=2768039 RepID=UPI00265E34EF|nr:L,D-transpeptidase [uncultured Duncaniella sp.]